MTIARHHSADMAAHGSIYHDYNLPNEVHGWREIGENVGRGPSATAVHDGFMGSSSHRVHILKPQYKQIGVGAVWATTGGTHYLYVTEVFVDRGSATHVSHPVPHHHAPAPAKIPPPKLAPPPPSPRSLTVAMLLRLEVLDDAIVAQKGMFPERLPP